MTVIKSDRACALCLCPSLRINFKVDNFTLPLCSSEQHIAKKKYSDILHEPRRKRVGLRISRIRELSGGVTDIKIKIKIKIKYRYLFVKSSSLIFAARSHESTMKKYISGSMD